MTKRTRKVKPCPAVVRDAVKRAEKDFPVLWIDYLAIAVLVFLCIILLAGVAGYVWGMVQ